jgi:AcrR family transcriptional regulator
MPRINKSLERQEQFIPVIARTFAELGYRRTTTAELARRCEVQETILYRLWPDKKKMFLEAIEYVYRLSEDTWEKLLEPSDSGKSTAERILDYESTHHGEFGLYRIIFAGLGEVDDEEIHDSLKKMYKRFHRFIMDQIAVHREIGRSTITEDLAAWAVIGLGTVANIGRELGLLGDRKRKQLIGSVGTLLLNERAD